MSLRDLNTGDRFTAEFEVSERTRGTIYTTCGVAFHIGTPIDVTKLPPRARPVRKGDEIGNTYTDTTCVLIGVLGDVVVGMFSDGPDILVDNHAWTHADGAPIDWEASE